MKISSFLAKQNLDRALLIGYYGGGNYGDELLLEVLVNFLAKYRAKNVSIVYQNPNLFRDFHKDFNYQLINPRNKFNFLKNIISHKLIVLGGVDTGDLIQISSICF